MRLTEIRKNVGHVELSHYFDMLGHEAKNIEYIMDCLDNIGNDFDKMCAVLGLVSLEQEFSDEFSDEWEERARLLKAEINAGITSFGMWVIQSMEDFRHKNTGD